MTTTLKLAASLAALLLFGPAALAQNPPPVRTTESAPTFDPTKLPGIRPVGPNYSINSPVRSDGFLRVYFLKTPYGDFPVHGDAMLRMRLNELDALARLEQVSNSETFNSALVSAGLSPVKYAGKLVLNPIKTIGDTLAGVGSLFGQVGSGLNNMGKTDDGFMAGLLGVTKEKRQLAVAYGVDPYTDFPPLAAKLTQLSEAAAAGGLVVTGALMVIPGAVGVVISNVSTANKLGDMRIEDLALDYTAAQIMDLNRQRLLAMGVDRAMVEMLLSNRNYTPVDMAAMVAAIDSMQAVQGKVVFIARAASIGERGLAFFVRRHAEVLAAYYAKTGAFTSFVSLGGFPFNTVRTGGVLGVMPIDMLSWTPGTSQALGASDADRRRLGVPGPAELWITGRATTLAKQKLGGMGWQVKESVRF